MNIFLQVVINGILFGTMYGIAAIGLSLIFGTMRIIFLAQGTMIVFFAYLVYWLFELAHLDPYLSLVIVVPFAFLVGLGLFYLLFRKAAALEDKNVSLLLAVGLMYLVENLMLKVWTANPRVREHLLLRAHDRISATSTSRSCASWRSSSPSWRPLVVYFFLKKTRLGTAVRAASEDMEATRCWASTPTGWPRSASPSASDWPGWPASCMATVYSFDPNYGFTFAIKALVALALGRHRQRVGRSCRRA